MPQKHKLTDSFINKVSPQHKPFLIWDTLQNGFALQVQPTGHKAFKCIYRFGKKPYWYHIASVGDFDVARARGIALETIYAAKQGKNPVAERIAERGKGTFKELADRYVNEYAKQKNKSWQHMQKIVDKHLVSRWGNLPATSITRAEVKHVMTSLAAIGTEQTESVAAARFGCYAIQIVCIIIMGSWAAAVAI